MLEPIASVSMTSVPHLIGAIIFFLLAIRSVCESMGSNTRRANRYLGFIFTCFFILLSDEFIRTNIPFIVWNETLISPTLLLIGPFTFLYTSSMLNGATTGSWRHFLPFLIYFSITFINYIILPSNKQIPTSLLFACLYLSTLLIYVYMSLIAINRYSQQVRLLYSDLKFHDLSLFKIWTSFITLFAFYIGIEPFITLWIQPPLTNTQLHYCFTILGMFITLFPNTTAQKSLADFPVQEKYDSGTPSKDELLDIVFRELKQQTESQHYYRQNGLTLYDLAQYIGFAEHTMSNALNQVGMIGFYDFINDYRIKEAKEKLVSSPSRAVIDIAMDVGFNSKSAFYTAFKKREQLSPSQYRKSQVKTH